MDTYDKLMIIALFLASIFINIAVDHNHQREHIAEYHSGVKK